MDLRSHAMFIRRQHETNIFLTNDIDFSYSLFYAITLNVASCSNF